MGNGWLTDLPNWLVAIGTIGAFGTGGVVLLRELARDREREEALVRQQATTIAVWPVRTEHPQESPPTVRAHATLSNASFEPVYDVTIEYRDTATTRVIADRVGLLPPGRYDRDLPADLQEVWIRTPDGWLRRGSPGTAATRNPQYQPWGFTIAVSFVDARGRRWRRDADGSMRERPEAGA